MHFSWIGIPDYYTSLDPKQARQKVGPDLDLNDLQRLSAIRQKSSPARKVFI